MQANDRLFYKTGLWRTHTTTLEMMSRKLHSELKTAYQSVLELSLQAQIGGVLNLYTKDCFIRPLDESL